MADAHPQRFDSVAVWKFDRFARRVFHLLLALETFQALGIHFVSLNESLDTSTPAGKMVFTILGVVAELERSNGMRLGRPGKSVDSSRVAALRSHRLGWRTVARQLAVGVGTLYRTSGERSETQKRGFWNALE